MRAIYILFFLLYTVMFVNGEELKDTLFYNDNTTQISTQKLILPTSLILVGSLGVCNNKLQSVNHSIRDYMTDLRGDNYFRADDYFQYLPVISHIGLEGIGVKSKHPFKERLIVATTSYLAMGIMVNGVKYTVRERRPDLSARNSFPSGHTATAFMGAELVRIEYGNGFGIGMYAIASGVAFLRLYNDRHWFNDVVAGAGTGILSARIGYWLLPVNKKLFNLDKKKSPMIATMPTYDYRNQALGMTFVAQF